MHFVKGSTEDAARFDAAGRRNQSAFGHVYENLDEEVQVRV